MDYHFIFTLVTLIELVLFSHHFLLQGLFPTQGSNPCLLHWQVDSLPLEAPGKLLSCIAWYIVSAKMYCIYEQYGTVENFSQYEFFSD